MIEVIKKRYAYFPIVGLTAYLILFLIATSRYPGGSLNDFAAEGHSFFHNFLCDLMLTLTQDGTINDARPIAILAHIMLSFAMISFFYILPEIFTHPNLNTKLVRGFGIFTMSIFVFMFTDYHDIIVTLVGLFGAVALIPFFIEFTKYQGSGLLQLAYLCFFMSVVLYIGYEFEIGFYYLPALQKATFLLDAWWVIWVSLAVAAKHRGMLDDVLSLK